MRPLLSSHSRPSHAESAVARRCLRARRLPLHERLPLGRRLLAAPAALAHQLSLRRERSLSSPHVLAAASPLRVRLLIPTHSQQRAAAAAHTLGNDALQQRQSGDADEFPRAGLLQAQGVAEELRVAERRHRELPRAHPGDVARPQRLPRAAAVSGRASREGGGHDLRRGGQRAHGADDGLLRQLPLSEAAGREHAEAAARGGSDDGWLSRS